MSIPDEFISSRPTASRHKGTASPLTQEEAAIWAWIAEGNPNCNDAPSDQESGGAALLKPPPPSTAPSRTDPPDCRPNHMLTPQHHYSAKRSKSS